MCTSLIPIPTAAALVFVFLVLLMTILILIVRPKGKSARRWLGVYGVIILGYIGFVCYTCGPNPKDVAVMKPLGDAVNRYLTTKGKPPSLDSIPDLPYKLECGSPYSCRFEKGGRVYKVWLQCDGYDDCNLELYIPTSQTGVIYLYSVNSGKFVVKYGGADIYSRKKTGICNPMRM